MIAPRRQLHELWLMWNGAIHWLLTCAQYNNYGLKSWLVATTNVD